MLLKAEPYFSSPFQHRMDPWVRMEGSLVRPTKARQVFEHQLCHDVLLIESDLISLLPPLEDIFDAFD